jgi:hypothetical protein
MQQNMSLQIVETGSKPTWQALAERNQSPGKILKPISKTIEFD